MFVVVELTHLCCQLILLFLNQNRIAWIGHLVGMISTELHIIVNGMLGVTIVFYMEIVVQTTRKLQMRYVGFALFIDENATMKHTKFSFIFCGLI